MISLVEEYFWKGFKPPTCLRRVGPTSPHRQEVSPVSPSNDRRAEIAARAREAMMRSQPSTPSAGGEGVVGGKRGVLKMMLFVCCWCLFCLCFFEHFLRVYLGIFDILTYFVFLWLCLSVNRKTKMVLLPYCYRFIPTTLYDSGLLMFEFSIVPTTLVWFSGGHVYGLRHLLDMGFLN